MLEFIKTTGKETVTIDDGLVRIRKVLSRYGLADLTASA